MLYIDLEKSITRTQAKAAHPKLPEGGAWRTIKGHHVYIKDGKVLAGAGVGATGKPIKLKKQHLDEHQAHVDKEAKKKPSKTKAVAASKPKAKTAAKKTTAKAPTKKAAPVNKKTTAPKKVASKPFAKMTDAELAQAEKTHNDRYWAEKAKRDVKESALVTQHKTTMDELRKENTKIGKMRMSKKRTGLFAENERKQSEQLQQHNDALMQLRKQHEKELEPFAKLRKESAHEYNTRQSNKQVAAKAKAAPKKTAAKKPTAPKTAAQHDKYHIAARNTQTGEHAYEVVPDAVHAPLKAKNEYFYHKTKMPSGKYDHRISEASTGMLVVRGASSKDQALRIAQSILDDKEHQVDAQIAKHHKEIGPSPYKLGTNAPKPKVAKQKRDLAKNPKKGSKRIMPPLVAYHGTELPVLSKIKESGFKRNGSNHDFGNAVYFKSPQYDALDAPHNDTKNIVNSFVDMDEPLVIKAHIPRDRVLDCSKGRPPELDALVRSYYGHDGENVIRIEHEYKQRMALSYVLGIQVPQTVSDIGVDDIYRSKEAEIKKALGYDFKVQHVSPYEMFAFKHKYDAVIDKIPGFDFEGVQVGVYNPKAIEIVDHGKELDYDPEVGGPKLKKAMEQAQPKANGYALMRHEFNDTHLVLHVGTYDDTKPMQKSLTTERGYNMQVFNAKDLNIVNAHDLTKSLEGGSWRTVHGQHVYIKDGTIVTGSFKGKKIDELGGGKANGSQRKQEGSGNGPSTEGPSTAKASTNGPTSVGEKASTNSSGASARTDARGQSQDGSGSGEATSPIRNLSKQAFPARSDREYSFHRLEGKEGAKEFHKAITASKEGNSHGAFVHAYEENEYDGMKMFLSEGGEAGFALKDNGDICSVFHNPKIGTKKGVLGHCMELSLQHGGTRLDCFDGFLPKQYAKWGFEPVAKVKFNREYAPEGWNFERDGEPDVLFFAHNGDSLDKVLNTSYPSADLSKTPTIEDYDDGLVHQDAYLEGRKSPIAKSLTAHLEIMKSLTSGTAFRR